jgi:hypothetical protein
MVCRRRVERWAKRWNEILGKTSERQFWERVERILSNSSRAAAACESPTWQCRGAWENNANSAGTRATLKHTLRRCSSLGKPKTQSPPGRKAAKEYSPRREPWVAKEKWTSREEEKRKRKLRHELSKDANHTPGNALGSLAELIRSSTTIRSADSFYPRLKSCV